MNLFNLEFYWVGQKVHSGFPIIVFRKMQTKPFGQPNTTEFDTYSIEYISLI